MDIEKTYLTILSEKDIKKRLNSVFLGVYKELSKIEKQLACEREACPGAMYNYGCCINDLRAILNGAMQDTIKTYKRIK